MEQKSDEESIQLIVNTIQQLPQRNKDAFIKLLEVLSLIKENEAINRMSASNLGTVVGPSICYPPPSYPTGKMMQEIHLLGIVISRMISLSQKILPLLQTE